MEGWMTGLYARVVYYMQQKELLKVNHVSSRHGEPRGRCFIASQLHQDHFLFWVDVTMHQAFAPAAAECRALLCGHQIHLFPIRTIY